MFSFRSLGKIKLRADKITANDNNIINVKEGSDYQMKNNNKYIIIKNDNLNHFSTKKDVETIQYQIIKSHITMGVKVIIRYSNLIKLTFTRSKSEMKIAVQRRR